MDQRIAMDLKKFNLVFAVISILITLGLVLIIFSPSLSHGSPVFKINQTEDIRIEDLHQVLDFKTGEFSIIFTVRNAGEIPVKNIILIARMDDKYPKSLLDIEKVEIGSLQPNQIIKFIVPLHYKGEYDQLHFTVSILKFGIA
jgi:hypothetical protein